MREGVGLGGEDLLSDPLRAKRPGLSCLARRGGFGRGGPPFRSVAREATRVVVPRAQGWAWEGRTPVPPPKSIVGAGRERRPPALASYGLCQRNPSFTM